MCYILPCATKALWLFYIVILLSDATTDAVSDPMKFVMLLIISEDGTSS
jgi:hypothetical protein